MHPEPLPAHWVNHEIGANISVLDRSFSYGDGLFETLRCHGGRFHLLDQHMQRLQLGCRRLEITCPNSSVQTHLELAASYLQQHQIVDASARLSVTRGSALNQVQGRGYGGAHGAANVVLSLYPCKLGWRQVPAPAHLICYDKPLAVQPLLAGVKHCNRLEQVLAARAVQREKADEAIMFNPAGQPICAVSANVFLVIGDSVVTPDVSQCGVAGTVRGLILDTLPASSMIHAEPRALELADLWRADEVILCNSLVGVQSVAKVDTHAYSATAVADTLRACFFDWVDAQAV